MLKSSVDSPPHAAFACDSRGRIVSASRALCERLQYAPEILCTMTCGDLIGSQDRNAMEQAFHTPLDRRARQSSFDLTLRRADDVEIPVQLTLITMSSAQEPDLFVGVVDERAATKNPQLTQQRGLENAERKAALAVLAATIAHDVNQSLTAISAYAQASQRMISKEGADLASLADVLEAISVQALRAGDALKRIRNTLKVDGVGNVSVDVNACIEAAIARIAAEQETIDCGLSLEFDPSLPYGWGDEQGMQSVFTNLIRNAVESMADNEAGDRRLSVKTLNKGPTVEVRVADSGAGIAPDLGDTVFDALQTTKSNASGMGLAISRSIITACGGSLDFERGAQGGTVFIVNVPAAELA